MDRLSFDRVAVLGAGGPTGYFLTTTLLEQGTAVRVIGRSRERLAEVFADRDVEVVAADATIRDATVRAAEGCDLVVDCIGLPPEQMQGHPETARSIAAAVSESGARCVQVSSFWAYLPIAQLPVNEEHPRRGGVDFVHWRREAEDILQEAGAAVVHLPDFYGPEVHTSTLQQPLREAIEGKPMHWIGSSTTPREYVFVPDAMRTVAELATRPEAYGERWIVPGAGPLTAKDVAEIASEHLGRKVKVRAAGPLMLRIASLFVKPLRPFMPMVPYYVRPIAYDASKLERLLGEQPVTHYREGIVATLDWMRSRG